MRSELSFYIVETEVGFVGVVLSEKGLRYTTLPRKTRDEAMSDVSSAGALREAPQSAVGEIARDIRTLATGKAVDMSRYVDWNGITPFRRAVLEETMRIPMGRTLTYAELAAKAGNPRAARAVGRVMATNPLPFVIPCHRVVGSNGTLHGYGGGLELKERLLRVEGALG
jgi:methylated-DNA-[protein]-cysteine S-methyltransferase